MGLSAPLSLLSLPHPAKSKLFSNRKYFPPAFYYQKSLFQYFLLGAKAFYFRCFNLMSVEQCCINMSHYLHKAEVLCNSRACCHRELSGCLVTHPTMHPSSARVNPQAVLETKVVWNRIVLPFAISQPATGPIPHLQTLVFLIHLEGPCPGYGWQ